MYSTNNPDNEHYIAAELNGEEYQSESQRLTFFAEHGRPETTFSNDQDLNDHLFHLFKIGGYTSYLKLVSDYCDVCASSEIEKIVPRLSQTILEEIKYDARCAQMLKPEHNQQFSVLDMLSA